MSRFRLHARLSQLLCQSVQVESFGTAGPALDRRSFAKRSGQLLTAALVPGASASLFACRQDDAGPGPRLRNEGLVIVGAGLAGLTCAYRLSRAGVGCALYDAAMRTGGRLYTEHHFNADGMYVERGGELIDSAHNELIALAGEVGIPLKASEALKGHEFFYAGGALRSEAEVSEALAPLAAVVAADAAHLTQGGDLLLPTAYSPQAANARIQELDRTSIAEYLNGISELEPWLLRLLQAAYAAELGRDAAELSALSLIGSLDFGSAPDFRLFRSGQQQLRIMGGSQALPDALTDQLTSKAMIYRGHRLEHIRDAGTHLILGFEHSGKSLEVKCERVVLALPFSVLREVDGLETLGLNPAKLQAIKELGYSDTAKLALGFNQASWRQSHKGCSSLLSDMNSQVFWDASQAQTGDSAILTNVRGGHAGRQLTPEAVQITLADLEKALPGSTASFDGHVLFQHWSSAPFQKGAYSCPLVGQFTSLLGVCGEPELSSRLLFAGEHASVDSAGYMNGAVETGNEAAREILSSLGMATKWSASYRGNSDLKARRPRAGRLR